MGLIGSHKIGGVSCTGTEAAPAQPLALASWLPICTGLTPHGHPHGHQTRLDELGIRYVHQSERTGHEVPGIRGVYSHITPGMRTELKSGQQHLWDESLRQRARLAVTSVVPVERLLAARQDPDLGAASADIGSRFALDIRWRLRNPAHRDREAGR